MKKKILILFIAACIALPVFAGGSQSGGAQSGGSTANQKINLKGFAFVNARIMSAVTQFNEVWAFQEAERATGIHVDWIHPPVGQETEQCNLMIASGDLPDFIFMNYDKIGGLSKLLSDGTIIKLNQYLDQGKMPNYKAIMDKYPAVKRQLLMDDGTLASFNMLRIREYMGQLGWFSDGGIMLRKDWMDTLHLNVPTTVAEYEAVLRAFKTGDPNGNGIADEIPVCIYYANGWSEFAQFFGMGDSFYDMNGTVKYGPIEPRYRDFVATIARWYADGLTDPDWITVDTKSYQAKFLQNLVGSSNSLVGNMGTLRDIMVDTIPGVDFVGIRNFKNDADGKVYSTLSNLRQSFVNEASMVTSKCTNIDATLKYLDWVYSPAGTEAFNWGQPDVSYTIKNGVKSFTDEVVNNPKGYPVERALSQYAMSMCEWSMSKDPDYWMQTTLRFPFQLEALDNWGNVDNAIAMPPISLTPDEAKRNSQIMNDIGTLKSETVTKIILGTAPVSALDNMVTLMKQMGIDEAIKIQQAALDRYYARK